MVAEGSRPFNIQLLNPNLGWISLLYDQLLCTCIRTRLLALIDLDLSFPRSPIVHKKGLSALSQTRGKIT